MNTLQHLNAPKVQTTKKRSRKERLKDPLDHDEGLLQQVPELVLPVSKFSAAAAYYSVDNDMLIDIFDFFDFCQRHNLMKFVNKSISDTDKYSSQIDAFRRMDSDALLAQLDEAETIDIEAVIAAFQRALYDVGLRVITLDDTMLKTSNGTMISQFFNISYDKESFSKGLAYRKRRLLIPGCEVLRSILPPRMGRSVKDGLDSVDYMLKLATDFVAGTLPVRLFPGKFKFPGQAGIFLPHYLDGRSWMIQEVSAILTGLFGSEVLPVFRLKNITHIYSLFKLDENVSCAYVDADENAPYGWKYTPSFYSMDINNNSWNWRQIEKVVLENVSSIRRTDVINNDISEYGSITNSFLMEQLLLQQQKEFPDEEELLVNGEFYPGYIKFSKRVSTESGFRFGLLIYSFKPSTESDVIQNPEYIHVVKATIATKLFSFNQGYMIQLVDLSIVLFIPNDLWKNTKHRVRELETGNTLLYSSKYGRTFKKDSATNIDSTVVALLSLALTAEKLKNLNGSKITPKIDDVVQKLLISTNQSKNKNFRSLFSGMSRSQTDKFMKELTHGVSTRTFRTLLMGETTKTGKSKLEELNRVRESTTTEYVDDHYDYENDTMDRELFSQFDVSVPVPDQENPEDDQSFSDLDAELVSGFQNNEEFTEDQLREMDESMINDSIHNMLRDTDSSSDEHDSVSSSSHDQE